MHVAEQGTGPLVVLHHGFPEFWYSWRHQITFLANQGYHVVAPDLRGYGDSDSPLNPVLTLSFILLETLLDFLTILANNRSFSSYLSTKPPIWKYLCLCLWLCSIIDIWERTWEGLCGGTWLGSCIKSRDLLASMFHLIQEIQILNLSNPLRKCLEMNFTYVNSRNREEQREHLRGTVVKKKFLLITRTDNLIAPLGLGLELIDYLEIPLILPQWITEEELQVCTDKFQESGFTGAFNFYRAMDL